MELAAAGIRSTPRTARIAPKAISLIDRRCPIATNLKVKNGRQIRHLSSTALRNRLPARSQPDPHKSARFASPRTNMSVSTKAEAEIKRNPHPDFKSVERSRPDWDASSNFRFTKTADPSWKPGVGANQLSSGAASQRHVPIDPYEDGRPAGLNYKLLISSIVPRPIGFVSTRSGTEQGEETLNLAPFSYFNMVNHDPPMFCLGIAASIAKPKDTLSNLMATKECTVNIISEHFIEAANSTSVDAPPGRSEWDVSGLTPVYDTTTVKAPRVGEAIFSVECRLESVREFDSKSTPGKKSGCLVVLEGTKFWAREDAVNEDRSLIDPDVLRPISRLGGITYGRTIEGTELPRPTWEHDIGGVDGYKKLKQADGNL